MGLSKDWIHRLFQAKMKDGDAVEHSLFKLTPFTFCGCAAYGVLFSVPVNVRHVIWFVAALLPRFWCTFVALRVHVHKKDPAIQVLTESVDFSLSFATFCFLWRKSSGIVTFLSSDASVAPKLHKVDRIWLVFLACLSVHTYLVFGYMTDFKSFFLPAALDSSPRLKHALFYFCYWSYLAWFDLSSLVCITFYSAGFRVLHAYKLSTLDFIRNNWQSVTPRVIVSKLKEVSAKQRQFESIFGPLLLFSLCYDFLTTIYLFSDLLFVVVEGTYIYYHTIVYIFYFKTVVFGTILSISRSNEALKDLSKGISDQFESKLIEGLPSRHFMVLRYLQNKIHSVINEPLTACKMVSLDRQIIVAYASSCISFSVLFIQINNGALASSSH